VQDKLIVIKQKIKSVRIRLAFEFRDNK